MDKQHQHLVEILNQLDEAVALGYEPQKVLKLVDELIDYTHYHFEDEERFMLEGGYDSQRFAEHINQHHKVIVWCTGCQINFEGANLAVVSCFELKVHGF